MIFAYWTVYVLIGILWLWRFIKEQPKELNNNVIASLFIVCVWPIDIIYNMFKK